MLAWACPSQRTNRGDLRTGPHRHSGLPLPPLTRRPSAIVCDRALNRYTSCRTDLL